MSLPYRWKAHPCPPVLSKPSPNEHSARRASPVTVTRPGASEWAWEEKRWGEEEEESIREGRAEERADMVRYSVAI